uniref:Uncharacterized protein n=1 Tax=viral metagenome TaxID=1070528 RepID=A0A6M3XLU4_9ZZZZ
MRRADIEPFDLRCRQLEDLLFEPAAGRADGIDHGEPLRRLGRFVTHVVELTPQGLMPTIGPSDAGVIATLSPTPAGDALKTVHLQGFTDLFEPLWNSGWLPELDGSCIDLIPEF